MSTSAKTMNAAKADQETKPADNDNMPEKPAPTAQVLDEHKSAFSGHFSQYLTRRAQSIKALCAALALAQKLALEMLTDKSKHDQVLAHLAKEGIRVTEATTVPHMAVKFLVPPHMHQRDGRSSKVYGGDRKRVSNWALAIEAANDHDVDPSEFPQWVETQGGLEAVKNLRKSSGSKIKAPKANEARGFVERKGKLNDDFVEIDLTRYAIPSGDLFVVMCRKSAGHKFDILDAIKDPTVVNRAAKLIYEKEAAKQLAKAQENGRSAEKVDDNDDLDDAA